VISERVGSLKERKGHRLAIKAVTKPSLKSHKRTSDVNVSWLNKRQPPAHENAKKETITRNAGTSKGQIFSQNKPHHALVRMIELAELPLLFSDKMDRILPSYCLTKNQVEFRLA